MAGPAFAVADRAEKLGDLLLDGSLPVAAGRFRKPGHFFRCGRQTDQVQVHPSEQGSGVRRGRRLQPRRFQLRQDEGVDGVPNPGLRRHLGRRGLTDRFPGPVAGPDLLPVRLVNFGSRRGRGHLCLRPGRAQPNPLHKVGHLPLLEPASGRHLNRFPAHGLDQQALAGPVGNDGGSPIAALQQFRTPVDPQVSLGFFDGVSVAGKAVPCQEGAHPALEKLQLGRFFSLGRQLAGRADPAESEDGANQ